MVETDRLEELIGPTGESEGQSEVPLFADQPTELPYRYPRMLG